jgi:hypothetical protein
LDDPAGVLLEKFIATLPKERTFRLTLFGSRLCSSRNTLKMRHQGRFKSKIEIVRFLYRAENINHKDIVYLNPTSGIGIFEDKSSGSQINLEFSDEEEVSKIDFELLGGESVVHQWARMFEDDFDATVEPIT